MELANGGELFQHLSKVRKFSEERTRYMGSLVIIIIIIIIVFILKFFIMSCIRFNKFKNNDHDVLVQIIDIIYNFTVILIKI